MSNDFYFIKKKTISTKSPDLVAYYPFRADSSDYSIYAAPTGTSVNVTYDIDDGAYFNGTSSLITTNSNVPTGTSAKSISLWMKSTAYQRGWMFHGGSNDANSGWTMFTAGSVDKNLIFAGIAADFVITGAGYVDNWMHVVITYDGGTDAKSYIDKVAKGSGTFSYRTAASPIQFGNRKGAYSEYYKGYLRDVAIYNRVLTTDEIASLYDGTIVGY